MTYKEFIDLAINSSIISLLIDEKVNELSDHQPLSRVHKKSTLPKILQVEQPLEAKIREKLGKGKEEVLREYSSVQKQE